MNCGPCASTNDAPPAGFLFQGAQTKHQAESVGQEGGARGEAPEKEEAISRFTAESEEERNAQTAA